MKISNIRIGKRLLIGFTIAVVFLSASGLYALLEIRKVTALAEQIYDHPLAVSNAVRDIRANINGMHRSMKDVALSESVEELNEASRLVDYYEMQVYSEFELVFDRFLGDITDVEDAHQAFKDWKIIRDEVIMLSREGNKEKAIEITKGKGYNHVIFMTEEIQSMIDFAGEKASEFLTEARIHQEENTIVVLAIIFFSTGLVIFISTVITRSIVNPLKIIVNRIENISHGNLGGEAGLPGNDEIGELAESFCRLQEDLSLKASLAERIAGGDFTEDIPVRSEKDDLGRSFFTMTTSLRELTGRLFQYKNIISATSDYMSIVGPDYRYITVNNSYLDSLGKDYDDIAGKHISDIFGEEIFKKLKPKLDSCLSGEKINYRDWYDLPKYGKRYIDVTYYPLIEHDSTITAVIVNAHDITELMQFKEKLNYQANLMENVSDAIIATDNDFRITSWNKAAENTYGYSENEVLGKPVSEILENDYMDVSRENVLKEYNEKGTWEGEVIQTCKDGSKISVLASVSTIKDTGGNISGAVAANRDITERVNADKVILDLNRRNQLILNSANEGIYGLDTGGNITFMNPAAAKMIGWEIEDVIGKNSHELFHHSYEDGSYYPPEKCVVYQAVEQGIATKVDNDVFWRKDGSSFPVLNSISPIFGSDNSIEGAVATFSDITDRIEYETRIIAERNRAENYLDIAGSIILALDDKGKITLLNKKGCDILGYDREEVIGLDWFDTFLPISTREEVRVIFNRLMNGEIKDLEDIEGFKALTKNGEERIMFWHNSLIKDKDQDGKIIGTLSSGEDITDRVKAEDERDRILDLSSDLICVASMDGYFKYLNPAWETILGYSLDELLERPFIDFIHPEDHGKNDEEVESLSEGNKTINFENRYIHKDGSIRNIIWNATPVKEDNVMYCIGKDITERKKNQIKIEQLNFALEAAQEMAKVGYWSYNIITRTQTWSDQMYKVLGRDPNLGPPEYNEHKESWHQDDREMFDEAVNECINGQPYNIIIRKIFNDGSIHFINSQGLPRYDDDGNIKELFGTSQDITGIIESETALVESEERYRTLFDNADVLVSLYDIDGRCIVMNRKTAEMFGGKPEDFTGKSFDELHPGDGAEYTQRIKEIIKTGNALEFDDEVKFPAGDRWLLSKVNPVKDSEGNIFAAQIISQDITDRKILENELKESEKLHREVLSNISDAVFITDDKGGFTYVCPNVEVIFGYDYEQIFDMKTIYSLFGQDIFEMSELQEQMVIRNIEFECQDSNGNSHDLLIDLKKVSIKDGSILYTCRDITDRKKAEDALRLTQEFNETILNTSPDVIYVYDIVEKKNIYSNDGILTVLGYSVLEIKEMGSKIIQILMHPDDFKIYREKTIPKYITAKDGQFIIHEYRMKHKDGTWRWLNAKESIFLRDDKGNPRQIFGIITDITERRLADKELKNSEEKFRKLFENTPFGIIINQITWDDHGKPVDFIHAQANPAASIQLGMNLDDLIGTKATEIADEETAAKFIHLYGEVVRTGKPLRLEQYFSHHDRTLDVTAFPLIGDFFITNFYDITDQKKADKALQESLDKEKSLGDIIRSASIGIATGYPDGRIGISNEAFQRLTGYSNEELSMIKWNDVLTPAKWKEIEGKKLVELLKTKKPVTYQKEYIRKDGSIVPIELVVHGKFDDEGNIQYFRGFVSDITERKQFEEALEESKKNLQELIYIASHDLQSPIVSMVGFAGSILKKYSDNLGDEGNYAVERIKSNAEKMHKVILSLLDLSRLDTVRNPHRKIKLNKMLKELLEEMALQISEHDTDIRIRELPDLKGDSIRIKTVFRNLLTNALIYGSRNIEVGFKKDKYYVQDDGIGISSNNLEKVFKAGERLKKLDVEGVGMGLTFSKRVIEQHKGKIWAESEGEGEGTTFYIQLGE